MPTKAASSPSGWRSSRAGCSWRPASGRRSSRGYRAYDFLRGDEPYKADWRAQPCPVEEIRIVPEPAGGSGCGTGFGRLVVG